MCGQGDWRDTGCTCSYHCRELSAPDHADAADSLDRDLDYGCLARLDTLVGQKTGAAAKIALSGRISVCLLARQVPAI